MSIQAVAWAIAQRTGGPTEKAILVSLANYADANGECYPSYQTLADDAEVSRRTVIRTVERLVETGLVEKTGKTRANGGDTTNVYRLVGCQNVTGGSDTGDTGGVTLVSPHMNHQSNPQPSKKATKAPADLVEAVWALQPVTNGKRKATRPDVKVAMEAAISRGADPKAILAALTAYYRLPDCRKDDGRFSKGAAVMLAADRWKDFLPQPEPPPRALDPAFLAEMTRHFHKTGEWRPEWGPKPAPPDRQAA